MYLKLLKEWILSVLTTHTKSKLCEMMDGLISLIVVNHFTVDNYVKHGIVHLKHVHFYINYTPINLEENIF